jgi:hypothetical protein
MGDEIPDMAVLRDKCNTWVRDMGIGGKLFAPRIE